MHSCNQGRKGEGCLQAGGLHSAGALSALSLLFPLKQQALARLRQALSILPLAISLFLLALPLGRCATTIPVAIPLYPKKNEKQIRSVLEGRRNVAIVAQRSIEDRSLKESERAAQESRNRAISKKTANSKSSRDRQGPPSMPQAREWLPSLEGAVSREISQLGFYRLVDISGRKERLQELAFSQSGVTAESLEIGRELEAGTFLFLRATNDTKARCRVEKISSTGMTALSVVTAVAISSLTNSEARVKVVRKRTGVLYLTLAVEGRLVNVETGRSVSYFYSEPYRSESKFGTLGCTSIDKVISVAIDRAAKEIAANLSPSITRLSAPLLSDSAGFKEPLKSKLAARLENGNAWAEEGDMKAASEQWQKALDETNGRSGSALWNLAIYHWQEGLFDQADDHFRRVKSDHPQLLDSRKRALIAQFNDQKKIAEDR